MLVDVPLCTNIGLIFEIPEHHTRAENVLAFYSLLILQLFVALYYCKIFKNRSQRETGSAVRELIWILRILRATPRQFKCSFTRKSTSDSAVDGCQETTKRTGHEITNVTCAGPRDVSGKR